MIVFVLRRQVYTFLLLLPKSESVFSFRHKKNKKLVAVHYVKEGPKVDSTSIEPQYATCADVKTTDEPDYVAGLCVELLIMYKLMQATLLF